MPPRRSNAPASRANPPRRARPANSRPPPAAVPESSSGSSPRSSSGSSSVSGSSTDSGSGSASHIDSGAGTGSESGDSNLGGQFDMDMDMDNENGPPIPRAEVVIRLNLDDAVREAIADADANANANANANQAVPGGADPQRPPGRPSRRRRGRAPLLELSVHPQRHRPLWRRLLSRLPATADPMPQWVVIRANGGRAVGGRIQLQLVQRDGGGGGCGFGLGLGPAPPWLRSLLYYLLFTFIGIEAGILAQGREMDLTRRLGRLFRR